jgi:tetratricopeptide (TPR) repeat protein
MNNFPSCLAISDVVLAAIISDIFWLLILLLAVLLFRRELKALFGSLARFEIAGAIVELKDRQSSFEYYSAFTKILTDILSAKESAERFSGFISDSSARELARVIRESAIRVPEDDEQIEIQKNIALIIGNKRHTAEAIRVLDVLLRKAPNDKEMLKSKARFLRDSGTMKNIRKAARIYDDLLKNPQNQSDPGLYYHRAQTRVSLEQPQLDGAFEDLKQAIDLGFWKWGYWKDAYTRVENYSVMLDDAKRPWIGTLKAHDSQKMTVLEKKLHDNVEKWQKEKEGSRAD